MNTPNRQIRALQTAETITVYQAYGPAIGGPAGATGRFPAAFKRDRMTWIKPSFLWMMYRCGWATKPGQEHVLAIEIRRSGFLWALRHSALSRFDSSVHATRESWERTRHQPVRLQWDPERDLHLNRLPHRSLQIGLSAEAVHLYLTTWITQITDITPQVHRIRNLITTAQDPQPLLPTETPMDLPADVALSIGCTRPA